MASKWYLSLVLLISLAACSSKPPVPTPAPVIEHPAVLTLAPAASSTVPQPGSSPTPTAPSTPTTELPAKSSWPDSQRYAWQEVVSGLEAPVKVTSAGDGSKRLFIVEQPGMIRVIQDGQLLPTPFLDIRERVGSQGSEQGLLGLAFHPQYARNAYFYVNYTDQQGGTVIARFSAAQNDPSRADPATEMRLLTIPQPYPNHNGGEAAFGPDGYLYLGLGDGGSAGDPQNNAQNLHSLLGKILRLDVDSREPYGLPSTNPFYKGDGLPPIWAYGLRNPWRFSFDRLTGDLYIGDVGQDQWEEIDFVPAGSRGYINLGWRYYEGSHPYKGTPVGNNVFIWPAVEYGHDLGCSVTGGVVYRGENLPEFQGIYLYGDYCSGKVWGLRRDDQGKWQNTLLFDDVARITSFGEDENGELYLTSHAGELYRLAATK